MNSTGFKLPTFVFANGLVTGNEWSDVNNILLVDGDVAASNVGEGVASDFTIGYLGNINIPQGSIITGIEIKVIGYEGAQTVPTLTLSLAAYDNTNAADVYYPYTSGYTGLTLVMATHLLGSSTYLFATTWTADQINNFKLNLAANGSISLDSVLINVHYISPATETLTYNTPTGVIAVGEEVLGAISGATATVVTNNGTSQMTVTAMTGIFEPGEMLTGQTSFGTVLLDGGIAGVCIDCSSPIQVQAMYLEYPFLVGQRKFYLKKGSFSYPDGTPVQAGDLGSCGGTIPFVFDESKRKQAGNNFEENAMLDTNASGTWTVLDTGVIEVDLGSVTQRGLGFYGQATHDANLMSDHDANSKVVISNNQPYNITLVRRCQADTLFSVPITVQNGGITLTTSLHLINFNNPYVTAALTAAHEVEVTFGFQYPIQFQDEGGDLGAAGDVLTINFTGLGVTATRVGSVLTVNVAGAGGSAVQSVTGLDTDNTDPLNPIVQVSVDGVTITGAGTPGSPLVAIGGGGGGSGSGTIKPKHFDFSYLHWRSVLNGYSDQEVYISKQVTTFDLDIPGTIIQTRDITSDYATATTINSFVVLGGFLYLLLTETGAANPQLWRYSVTNIAAGGTLMTVAGVSFGTPSQFWMSSDGTDLFFTKQAGNSADSNIISQYSISGTTITWIADVTCGAVTTAFSIGLAADVVGNIYGLKSQSSVSNTVSRFDNTGTLLDSYDYSPDPTSFASALYNWGNVLYTFTTGNSSPVTGIKYADRLEFPGMDNFGGGGGGSAPFSINQTAHGFAVGDVIRPDTNQWTSSQADVAADAEAWAQVTAVIGVNNFIALPLVGTRQQDAGIVALIAGFAGGDVLYVDATTPGAFTNIAPSAVGEVTKPIGYVEADSGGTPISLLTVNYRGQENQATPFASGDSHTVSADENVTDFVANEIILTPAVGGTSFANGIYIISNAGATAVSDSLLGNSPAGFTDAFEWDGTKIVRLEDTFSLSVGASGSTTGASVGFGFADATQPNIGNNSRKIAILADSTGVLFGVTSDGATTTSTSLGIAYSNVNLAHRCVIVWDPVTPKVDFYVDGVLRATNTTNIPSTSNQVKIWAAAVINTSGVCRGRFTTPVFGEQI